LIAVNNQTKTNEMKTEIKTITPEMAADILNNNYEGQRNVRLSHVKYLAREMKRGEWSLNGKAIIFDKNGRLIDGQQRMHAVILSGISITTLVVYGASTEAFFTIDKGAPRSNGDMLTIAGMKNATNAAAMLQFVWKYRDAKERDGSLNMYRRPSPSELAEMYRSFGDDKMTDAAKIAKACRRTTGIGASILGGSWLICQEIDAIEADFFFDKLTTGEMLASGNPIFTLREKLQVGEKSERKLSAMSKAAFIFKAWNAMREGRSIKMLRHNFQSDAFPWAK